MAVGPATVWVANEILTAAALVGEFANIYNNGQEIGWPRDGTAATSLAGFTLTLDGDADTTLRADTDDEIDIAINGVDTYLLTATYMTILGKRVLTTEDRVKLLAGTASILQINTVAARVTHLESHDAVTMAQLNNF